MAYVPDVQSVGSTEPNEQALPAGQVWHALPETAPVVLPKRPASHMVTAPAPTAQKPPSSHTAHAVLPLLPWYVPAAHGEQLANPSSAATVPVAQSVAAVAPRLHAMPAGQGKQAEAEDWAVRLPKVPALHRVTEAAPAGQ